MRKEAIIKTLLGWNFWEKELNTGVAREMYVKEALRCLKAKKVVTIVGIRRAGKSFISRQIVSNFLKEKRNSLIVNFEEARFDEALDTNFLIKIYDAYLSTLKPNEKPLIILDEVQEVKEWEKFVRSINEKDEAFLVVTGSSAKIMGEELATLLTGRTLTMEVFPLAFNEFLQFKKIKIGGGLELIKKEGEVKELLKEYVSFGGFPEVVLQDDRELKMKILASYYYDMLNKDVVKRFRVRRIDKLERIAFYYLTNFSSQITFNRIGKFLKFGEKTAEVYSKHIESSKMVFFLKRFSSSVKEQENSPRKVYLTDVGFHNLSNVSFSDKISKIYENIVAVELLKKNNENLFYWKDNLGNEVDFAVKDGSKVRELIQVCYDVEGIKTKERELKGLLKAMERFELEEALVITEDEESREKIRGKTINYAPLWKWLLREA